MRQPTSSFTNTIPAAQVMLVLEALSRAATVGRQTYCKER